MSNEQRLELTWTGKDEQPKLEQQGKKRAVYAEETLKKLSIDLIKEFGKGFSERNLENMRRFYLLYSSKISQTVFAKSKTVLQIPTEIFS